MEKYVSHFSAASHWNIPCLEDVLGAEYISKNHSNSADITVTDWNTSYQQKRHIRHLCGMALPRGAVVRCGEIFIASPELVFLELACELDIHRLILLGLQLCAHPPGKSVMAVTTKRKLETFLKKTAGHRGHKKASRALKYIESGTASIMESIAFMILTLPHLQGGFGLHGARFNQEIPLDSKAKRQLGQNRCFVDLFYEKEKLAVEYDSFAHHSSPFAQGKDLQRAAALERLGIDTIRLGTTQLYDRRACEELAQNIAVRLGRRIRVRSKGFQAAHEELRKRLPCKS